MICKHHRIIVLFTFFCISKAKLVWFPTKNKGHFLYFRKKNLIKLFNKQNIDEEEKNFYSENSDRAVLDDNDELFLKLSKYSINDTPEFEKLDYKITTYLRQKCPDSDGKFGNEFILEILNSIKQQDCDLGIFIGDSFIFVSNTSKEIVEKSKYREEIIEKRLKIGSKKLTDNSAKWVEGKFFQNQPLHLPTSKKLIEANLLNPYEDKGAISDKKNVGAISCEGRCEFINCDAILRINNLKKKYQDYEQPLCIHFREELFQNRKQIDLKTIEFFRESDLKKSEQIEKYIHELRKDMVNYIEFLKEGFNEIYLAHSAYFLKYFDKITEFYKEGEKKYILLEFSFNEQKYVFYNILSRIYVSLYLFNNRIWAETLSKTVLIDLFKLDNRVVEYLSDSIVIGVLNSIVNKYESVENSFIKAYIANHIFYDVKRFPNNIPFVFDLIEDAKQTNLFDGLNDMDDNFLLKNILFNRYRNAVDFGIICCFQELIPEFQYEKDVSIKYGATLIEMNCGFLCELIVSTINQNLIFGFKLPLIVKNQDEKFSINIFLPLSDQIEVSSFAKIIINIRLDNESEGIINYGYDKYNFENNKNRLVSTKSNQRDFRIDEDEIFFYEYFYNSGDGISKIPPL